MNKYIVTLDERDWTHRNIVKQFLEDLSMSDCNFSNRGFEIVQGENTYADGAQDVGINAIGWFFELRRILARENGED